MIFFKRIVQVVMLAGACVFHNVGHAQDQPSLTYNGFTYEGTGFGCAFAPKRNFGPTWFVEQVSARFELPSGKRGPAAIVYTELSDSFNRRFRWQVYNVPISPDSGARVWVRWVWRSTAGRVVPLEGWYDLPSMPSEALNRFGVLSPWGCFGGNGPEQDSRSRNPERLNPTGRPDLGENTVRPRSPRRVPNLPSAQSTQQQCTTAAVSGPSPTASAPAGVGCVSAKPNVSLP